MVEEGRADDAEVGQQVQPIHSEAKRRRGDVSACRQGVATPPLTNRLFYPKNTPVEPRLEEEAPAAVALPEEDDRDGCGHEEDDGPGGESTMGGEMGGKAGTGGFPHHETAGLPRR